MCSAIWSKGMSCAYSYVPAASAHLALDVVCFRTQLFHLPVIVPPLNRHLLILALQSLDRLLTSEALVLGVSLGTFELLLRV